MGDLSLTTYLLRSTYTISAIPLHSETLTRFEAPQDHTGHRRREEWVHKTYHGQYERGTTQTI